MQPPARAFRDFGILPTADLRPPKGTIRSYLSGGKIVGQYLFTGIVAALGVGLMLLCVMLLPPMQSLLGGVASLLAFSAFIYLGTHNDYRWVELDGNALRAKRLYTGQIVERNIDEIDCLGTMVYQVRQTATVIVEKLLGRVKGIEIRFRDGRTPLRVLRADPAMTNAEELIEAVVYRMSQLGELETEIVEFNGQPLVRNIHWKGRPPNTPPSKGLKASFASLAAMALLFGAILGFWGAQERERLAIGSIPAQRIQLATLIANGPGANRHVTITDFRPGGYIVETENDKWQEVSVALFPPGGAAHQIRAVLVLRGVHNETQLRQAVSQPVTGICSATPRSSWGVTLGPKLVEANHGQPLESAWTIEEMRTPPSKDLIQTLTTGCTACFLAVWLFAGLILWKAF